jgi:hypothetical protein
MEFYLNSGSAEVWFAESLQDLVDLPEMSALVRRQHAKRAIHVVAEAGIHRRLNLHLVDGQASRGPYGFCELSP